jgi:hypothetical protein
LSLPTASAFPNQKIQPNQRVRFWATCERQTKEGIRHCRQPDHVENHQIANAIITAPEMTQRTVLTTS